MNDPRRYIVTTHRHLPGARLSRCGDWGNRPFADVAAAEAFARSDSSGKPFSIERAHYKGLKEFQP